MFISNIDLYGFAELPLYKNHAAGLNLVGTCFLSAQNGKHSPDTSNGLYLVRTSLHYRARKIWRVPLVSSQFATSNFFKVIYWVERLKAVLRMRTIFVLIRLSKKSRSGSCLLITFCGTNFFVTEICSSKLVHEITVKGLDFLQHLWHYIFTP
jgi:hypothetical protein